MFFVSEKHVSHRVYVLTYCLICQWFAAELYCLIKILLECVRVSVCAGCMCVRTNNIGLSGSTLSPQTGCSLYRIWCHILSDVCLPTGPFGQESTCPRVRVCVCMWACVFSPQPSTRRHFLDWCMSLGAGGKGSSTERELIMQRDLERWPSRLKLYSCHTGHGVHCAAVVWGELRHTDRRDRVKMRKRSDAVGLCVVKLEWVILDG